MSWGVLVEAEYEDGFILTEDEDDTSPYDEGRNVFHAIINDRPVAEHGLMVRWSIISPGKTYNVDWTALLAAVNNPRPIYYRNMQSSFIQGSSDDHVVECLGHFFGYQYNDEYGSNQKDIISIEA